MTVDSLIQKITSGQEQSLAADSSPVRRLLRVRNDRNEQATAWQKQAWQEREQATAKEKTTADPSTRAARIAQDDNFVGVERFCGFGPVRVRLVVGRVFAGCGWSV